MECNTNWQNNVIHSVPCMGGGKNWSNIQSFPYIEGSINWTTNHTVPYMEYNTWPINHTCPYMECNKNWLTIYTILYIERKYKQTLSSDYDQYFSQCIKANCWFFESRRSHYNGIIANHPNDQKGKYSKSLRRLLILKAKASSLVTILCSTL